MDYRIIDIKRISHLALVVSFFILLLVVAQNILTPLVFAIFFALLLQPINDFFSTYIKWHWLSILLSFIVLFLPIIAGFLLFIFQLRGVVDDVSLITERLEVAINDVFQKLNEVLPISRKKGINWLSENMATMIDQPFDFLSKGLATSTTFAANSFLVLIYTFFFLYYREGIKSFLLQQVKNKYREGAMVVMRDIQAVSQNYLTGLFLVIMILGLMNSIGLMIIGLDYAFFWGFLAAILAIIPYIGTFIGGVLPLLYSLAVTDTLWQPLAIIGLFIVVQSLEGNFITPKVVGNSVQINPLAAILSLLTGAAIWGIAGMILALPVIAVIKVFCDNIPPLKPIGFLISSNIGDKPKSFLENWDDDKYRLSSYFTKPYKN